MTEGEPASPGGGVASVAKEVVPGVFLLPVVHARVDMAGLVRAVLADLEPRGVAVEIPTTLANATARAVARLPKASVVVSEEDDEEDALVWVVIPGDPLVEALRWAAERGRARFFIDPDVRYVDRHADPVPDPHAIWQIGPDRYLDLLTTACGARPYSDGDELREQGMAFHVQRAVARLDGEPLLVLVGAAHAERLAERLQTPQIEPLARVRRSSVTLRHIHPDSLSAVLQDSPLAHSVLEVLRQGEPPDRAHFGATVARRVSMSGIGLRIIAGARQEDREKRRIQIVEYAANTCNRLVDDRTRVVDRAALTDLVWRVGAASYEEQTREVVQPWQRRLFHDFLRRLTRIQSRLVPSVYEWVVGGRSVADDNLAWELFDVARAYPWQAETAEIPVARIDGSLLDLGTHKVRFRRRFFKVKQRPIRVPVKRHAQVKDPSEWLQGFVDNDGTFGLCSYPPEDLIIEDYSRFLQQKAVSLLSSERKRTEPFTCSLLDGIEIRETLRNVHEDRIYVQELGRAPGGAGSVVIIFDRDLDGHAFPYLMTWLGEHDEESDMAFFSTNPAEQIVGPGITRVTYGGVMLTMPPGRLFDVWRDSEYRGAQEKADVLLMAAVDYSTDRIVVHVAKDPPPERMKRYARLHARRLVHIPIGTLSPIVLKKIRVAHLLAGHEKRLVAKDYIW